MPILKLLVVLVIFALLTACSSTAKNIGSNIPFADEGIGDGDESGPLQNISFAYDSHVLGSTERDKLDSNVAWLMENEGISVSVEGHCDERGTSEYNVALGLRRARTVYNYYVRAGVDANRLSVISYGEELPVVTGFSESAWGQNRRVHSAVR